MRRRPLPGWWIVAVGVLLAVNLAAAVAQRDRLNWIAAAILALALAEALRRRWRDPPSG